LEAFKNSITTMPTQSVPSENYSEDLAMAMASLQLKENEIASLNLRLENKDTQINTLKGSVIQKEKEAKEAKRSKRSKRLRSKKKFLNTVESW
jgi:hypothetical protein